MLGSLAFISILVALFLLYASGSFYAAGDELSLKGTGQIAEEDLVNNVLTTTIPPDSNHRLVVFGDAWSAIGSRLAAQGQAWPQWVCSMVSNYTPSNCVNRVKAYIHSGHVAWKHMRKGNMSVKALSADLWLTEPSFTPSFPMPPVPWSHCPTFAARLTNGLLQS